MCGLQAQNRKGEVLLSKGCDSHELYFAVKARYSFRNVADPARQLLGYLPELGRVLGTYDYKIGKGIPLTSLQLEQLESGAVAASGSSAAVNKLLNIFRLSIDNPTNARLYELALELEKLEGIDYASLLPLSPVAPPADIMPVTPDYRVSQTYLDADPGVNMKAAWTYGLKGKGIRVRDVEYGFNKLHEDLNPLTQSIAPGMPLSLRMPASYTEHGTAVSGIMNAPDNGYGITGMVHEMDEFILYPEWVDTTYNRVRAVTASIGNSKPGDVIVYEMQTGGVGDRYVPAEYNNVIWDLTRAATDAGIIIVAAAGNGNQNLDSPGYSAYRSRGHSGAIIVGAGLPNSSHNRASFSTYGTRVDLQGWGSGVLATGYGDYAMIGADTNQSYTLFSGTSAATPIVASCIVALQGHYHKESGAYLSAGQLLEILQTTGIPQGDPDKGRVGPLPDMAAAFTELKSRMAGIGALPHEASCAIYPNPAGNFLNVVPAASLGTRDLEVSVTNVLGQQVYRSALEGRLQLDLSAYVNGIYLVQVRRGAELLRSARIVKQ